jgi:hypothetical protein
MCAWQVTRHVFANLHPESSSTLDQLWITLLTDPSDARRVLFTLFFGFAVAVELRVLLAFCV